MPFVFWQICNDFRLATFFNKIGPKRPNSDAPQNVASWPITDVTVDHSHVPLAGAKRTRLCAAAGRIEGITEKLNQTITTSGVALG